MKMFLKKLGYQVIVDNMKIGTLYSIQFLRAVAIFIVVLYHTYVYTSQYSNDLYIKVPHEFGILGVMLFFSISGFIMSYLLDKNESYFLLRRIARIYPTYILIVMGVIFLKVLIFSSIELPLLVYSLSLLPWQNIDNLIYPLGVEWSLVYEMFFYLVCSLMTFKFFNTKKRVIFMLLWMVIIFYYNLVNQEISPMRPVYDQIFLSIFNIAFIFGFLSYFLFKNIKLNIYIKYIYLVLIILIIFFIELILFRNIEIGLFKIVSISFLNNFLIILLLLTDSSFKEKKYFLRIGDNSYSLYLVHVVFITISLSILKNILLVEINTFWMITIFLSSFVIGSIVGIFDNLIHRFFRKKINNLEKDM